MKPFTGRINIKSLGRWLFIALLMVQSGCGWMYFRSAGAPPTEPVHYNLADWPKGEYWTGIVFNGAKIGFTHFALTPAENAENEFDIRSEAVLHFRFLMFDKKVTLKSFDRVADDLTLRYFAYDYDLDGNKLSLEGRVTNGFVEVEIASRGETRIQTLPIKGRLYPTSGIGLYPVLHGLEIGHQFSFQVYDGETQSINRVNQKIVGFEESDLFTGKAFKMETRLLGQKVTTWIDLQGRPQLEIAQNGVLISGLESEVVAKEYLTEATINKDEAILEYSLIKTEVSISEPENVTDLEVAMSGIDEKLNLPSDGLQQCERQGKEVICRIGVFQLEDTHESHSYLLSSQTIPSRNAMIRQKAAEITGGETEPIKRVRLLMGWIDANIEQELVDVFTALDVLVRKKAECQGHTYLYAAFARSLKIPTRVVNGIVYSKHYDGFLYHTWAESLIDGRWVAVDPTLGQIPADATHIKLVEGESPLDLMPLADLVGRLQVEIIKIKGQ